jgi:hypothetical protein
MDKADGAGTSARSSTIGSGARSLILCTYRNVFRIRRGELRFTAPLYFRCVEAAFLETSPNHHPRS